jgi:hypothetical protein
VIVQLSILHISQLLGLLEDDGLCHFARKIAAEESQKMRRGEDRQGVERVRFEIFVQERDHLTREFPEFDFLWFGVGPHASDPKISLDASRPVGHDVDCMGPALGVEESVGESWGLV